MEQGGAGREGLRGTLCRKPELRQWLRWYREPRSSHPLARHDVPSPKRCAPSPRRRSQRPRCSGSGEGSGFATEIRETKIQTKDGPIPMANWMNANEQWRLFASLTYPELVLPRIRAVHHLVAKIRSGLMAIRGRTAGESVAIDHLEVAEQTTY